ncbi:MAG TPA: hypothetical protein VHD90_12680 [Phototrophicaceae bacterium]|nr:hypothetical protein [Phototrophicaceae bacterium]
MPDHYQLANFEVQDAGGSNLVVLVSGSRKYYDILRHAFSRYRFSRAFNDHKNRFDWGTYIYNINDPEPSKLVKLLTKFKEYVCIDDIMDQTFALDYHSYANFDGIGKTDIGKLVYAAKPYHQIPSDRHRAKAHILAKHFVEFIDCHPSYKRSDYLIAVPPNPGKTYDLPTILVEEICTKLKMSNGSRYIRKARETKMKDRKTLKEKTDEINGAFEIVGSPSFEGKNVTIIDDIYQTGVTLHEVALVLQSKGATVQGLVATKTLRDLD